MSMNVQVNKDADDYCHLNTLNYSASATDGTMQCHLYLIQRCIFRALCSDIYSNGPFLFGTFRASHKSATLAPPAHCTQLHSACPNKLFRILDNLMTALGTFEYIAFNLQQFLCNHKVLHMLNMLCFVYWGRVNTEQSAHWLAAEWQELTWTTLAI